MRWTVEQPLTSYDYGRTRVIEKFLWFPREIDHEVRWLEKVMIEQVVTFDMAENPDSVYFDHKLPQVRRYHWRDSKWIDPPINLR